MQSTTFLKSGFVAGAIACILQHCFRSRTYVLKTLSINMVLENMAKRLPYFRNLQRTNGGNATLHYYSAMCFQSLGKMSEARSEFSFVATNGDPTLKVYAQRALAALNKAHWSANVCTKPGGRLEAC